MVGLELSLSLSDGDYRLVVSIPHCGLGTLDYSDYSGCAYEDNTVTIPPSGLRTLPPKNLENQNFLPLKVETAHREGTLTHIQLPS
jgi:hypothetical protein